MKINDLIKLVWDRLACSCDRDDVSLYRLGAALEDANMLASLGITNEALIGSAEMRTAGAIARGAYYVRELF